VKDRETHNQGGWGTILNDLSGDDGIAEEGPEESGDCTCVQSGEDDEGGGALLEEGTGADELEGECEEVYDEESTELDTACQVEIISTDFPKERERTCRRRLSGGYSDR
jgi:hypothetical protein